MEQQMLSGECFAGMMKSGAANLNANRTIVNDLNVFPVPDGDTGDNMYMTIESGVTALTSCESTDLSSLSGALAKGMLMGARGNSGVILSRIFAGIAKALKETDCCDIHTFGEAMECGVKESYQAVSNPVEGTILTVFRDSVRFANSRISDRSNLRSYFEDLLDEMKRALDRTPDQLAVLKEAGVVDSGGAGLVYIAEGMKCAAEGREIAYNGAAPSAAKPAADLSKFNENSVLEYGYCTEFLLQLTNAKLGDVTAFDENVLFDYLKSAGDSVVCFRDGHIVKVHIHTMTPGVILNECQKYGEFLTLKIENMTLQHNETTIENRYVPKNTRHKAYGIVSVASGEGLRDTFSELGTDVVIDGGQSMNPSVESFLSAFDQINADTILVFPNNSNIILTANQAASLYTDSDIRVLPSKTVGEGYAAISMLDTSSGDTDAIVEDLKDIMSSVVTGEIAQANRDTVKDGVEIKSGDYIGFAGGKIYTDSPDKNEAACNLLEKLSCGNYDISLIFYGKDSSDEEAAALAEALQAKFKKTEIITMPGNQAVYDYIIILE